MKSCLLAFGFVAVCLVPAFGQIYAPRGNDLSKSLAPAVPSPQSVVDRMLEAAHLMQGETVYDLGCGDGRILIAAVQKYRVKAVGIELSPTLAKAALANIRRLNLQDQASVIEGDMREVDLSPADVVFLYLVTEANEQMKPRLEKYLRPGARVVSHDFEVRGWKPLRTEDTGIGGRRPHVIYVYQMPPNKK